MKKIFLLFMLQTATITSCTKSSDDTPAPNPKGNPPTVDFNYTYFGTYAPVYVQFSNSSTNADSYWWDYGDGITSTEKDPIHQYTTSGTFNIKLTATNSWGSSSKTKSITITPRPTTAKISQLHITSYPITTPTSTGWDSPNTPDIYFQISDSIGNVIYDGYPSTAFNFDTSFLPFTWTLPIPQSLSIQNSPYYIVFYDYDSPPAPPQFMGNLILNFSDYTSTYPPTIDLSQNSFAISLDVTWQ